MTQSDKLWQSELWAHGENRSFFVEIVDHVLIPEDTRSHSKQSSTSVERSKIFRTNKTKIGEYRVKFGRVHSYSIVTLTHSLTHPLTQYDDIVAFASIGGNSHKKRTKTIYNGPECSLGYFFLFRTPENVYLNWRRRNVSEYAIFGTMGRWNDRANDIYQHYDNSFNAHARIHELKMKRDTPNG